ncbi:hypothetical protein AB4254_11905 [Vibrio breoganii]
MKNVNSPDFSQDEITITLLNHQVEALGHEITLQRHNALLSAFLILVAYLALSLFNTEIINQFALATIFTLNFILAAILLTRRHNSKSRASQYQSNINALEAYHSNNSTNITK